MQPYKVTHQYFQGSMRRDPMKTAAKKKPRLRAGVRLEDTLDAAQNDAEALVTERMTKRAQYATRKKHGAALRSKRQRRRLRKLEVL